MLKLKVFSVGKNKEAWMEQALEEYVLRLKPVLDIDFIWVKNDAQLVALVQKEKQVVCLDPDGEPLDSPEFSAFFHRNLQAGGSRLSMVIGGAEGLPEILKKGASLISLSRLTFTHQLARLILIEQVYRAFEIAKGTAYHK